MKRLIFPFLLPIMAFILSGCGGNSSNKPANFDIDRSAFNNREMYSLDGPVFEMNEVVTEKKKGRKKSELISNNTYQFDTNGRLIKSIIHHEDGTSDTLSFKHDIYGRDDFSDHNAKCEYDAKGHIKKVLFFHDNDNEPFYVYNYDYDDEGRLISFMAAEATVDLYGGCPDYSFSYSYSEDGHLSEKNFSNTDDQNTIYFSYDGSPKIDHVTEYIDDNEYVSKYTYTEFDEKGNWLKAEIPLKTPGKKNQTQYIERTIEYYDSATVLSSPIPLSTLSESTSSNASLFSAGWFDNLRTRYIIYSAETSSESGALIITTLILMLVACCVFIWYFFAIGAFQNFTGTIQSNGMKRLWMYNWQPYSQAAIVSLCLFAAFVTAILILFLLGGLAWGLMGLVWLILKALIFVGYACAILGGLALLGREGVGCLPLIIGIIIIVWEDDINRWAQAALDWGQTTFNNLNIFGWGWNTVTTFWDVLLIAFLTPLVLFLAFALIVIILDCLLMGIEWVITRIYSISRPCPSCGSKRNAEYIVGGKPHPVRLAPGIYGTFTQRSPVTGEKLPTMLMNGRGKLRRRCKDCGQYMDSASATRSFGTEMHIGLVGPRASGKSYLVYSALKQLMDDFPERIEQIDKDPETDIAVKANRIDSHDGIQTRLSNRYRGIQLIVKSKLRPVPYHLFFYDVAGEKFNAASQASRTAMEFYRNVQSIIFIVDPFMIDYSRLPASERMRTWDRHHTSASEKNDLTSTFEMMCRILEEQGRSMSKIDFTFAVVKTDGGFLSALDLPDHGNPPEVIEAFMTNDLGLRNIIDGARARFRNVSFGSTSVYGQGRNDMRSLFRDVLKRLGLNL